LRSCFSPPKIFNLQSAISNLQSALCTLYPTAKKKILPLSPFPASDQPLYAVTRFRNHPLPPEFALLTGFAPAPTVNDPAVPGNGGRMKNSGLMKPLCIAIALCAVTAISSPAQTYKSFADFDSTDGANPFTSLVQGFDGSFYGTTTYGGTNNGGTVFKVTPEGKITALYSFCSLANCADGEYPQVASLVLTPDGDFYGATYYGGVNCPEVSDCSTTFKITPQGKLTTLHTFNGCAGCKDGVYPSSLIYATDGNFYGTTSNGGVYGGGIVFKMTPQGTVTTLYSFCAQTDCRDGKFPDAGLIQASNGNFYGTTLEGGCGGCGTVFEITPAGKFTSLYAFCRTCNAGSQPHAPLIQATDGNLYGTSWSAVYKITLTGAETTLHVFCTQPKCGGLPYAGLVQATDGNFYGTTYEGGGNGGGNGSGTLFRITSTGKFTNLYDFCEQTNCTDGSMPTAAMLQGTDGNIYGMTGYGGTYTCSFSQCGNVFRLSLGLGPFIATVPTAAQLGAKVIILGNDLEGTTGVTFNGTAAEFTVVSATEIKTSVPEGATTGTVEVTTSKGTLKSNVVFRVAN
jgi:uncharacterized repeat protein (TIGR03803 family)